jgi:hypothetical protein
MTNTYLNDVQETHQLTWIIHVSLFGVLFKTSTVKPFIKGTWKGSLYQQLLFIYTASNNM